MSSMHCSSCGKEIRTDWKLCPYCGKELMPPQDIIFQPTIPSGKKEENKLQQNIWLISLCSGILTLISLLFPVAYATIETPFIKTKITSYFWIWGFIYSIKGFSLIEKENFFQVSFFLSFLLLLCGCFSILISKRFAAKKIKVVNVRDSYIGIGLTEIGIIILWLLFTDTIFPGIWAVYTIGFGIIGIFIAGTLLILVTFILEIPEYIKKEKEEIGYDKERERRIAIIVLAILIIFMIVMFSVLVTIIS